MYVLWSPDDLTCLSISGVGNRGGYDRPVYPLGGYRAIEIGIMESGMFFRLAKYDVYSVMGHCVIM